MFFDLCYKINNKKNKVKYYLNKHFKKGKILQ